MITRSELRERLYGLSVWESNEHGYAMTYVQWRAGRVESLQSVVDGCADNKAGYQSQHIADCIAKDVQEIMAQGFTHHFDQGWGGVDLLVKFQKYRPSIPRDGDHVEWCRPTINPHGAEIDQTRQCAAVLGMLLKSQGDRFAKMRDPVSLCVALRKLAPTYLLANPQHGKFPVQEFPAEPKRRSA